jgi:prepilin-type N-terminal cleavage/methylation domain-containing protein
MSKRNGFSLAEVVIAVALVAMLGLALMTLVSSGAQVGARAGEMQMATMVGARVIDRMVAVGHAMLERKARRNGPDGVLDLTSLDQQRPEFRRRRDPNAGDVLEAETRESRTLTIDGYEYSGRYMLVEAAPGLMRVSVMISWERYGLNGPRHPGTLEVVRYVADPLAGLNQSVAAPGDPL